VIDPLSEVPLTPTREYRRELYAHHLEGLAVEARDVRPMAEGCYPVVSMIEDSLRSVTVVNVTCDHGASAVEVSFAEQQRDNPGACIKAVEGLFADRHPDFPPPVAWL
jgi:hypothetical protein